MALEILYYMGKVKMNDKSILDAFKYLNDEIISIRSKLWDEGEEVKENTYRQIMSLHNDIKTIFEMIDNLTIMSKKLAWIIENQFKVH